MTQTRIGRVPSVLDPELAKIDLVLLAIIKGQPKPGPEIREELDDYFGEEINHGRVYGALDRLEEKGYLTQEKLDGRTNEYELTDRGGIHVLEEILWLLETIGIREAIVDVDTGREWP